MKLIITCSTNRSTQVHGQGFVPTPVSRAPHPGTSFSHSLWCSDQAQVTGTPGSGKTTLLVLLHHLICKERPNSQVVLVNGWLEKELGHVFHKDRWSKVDPNWNGYGNSNFHLINEGHTSYWDQRLWKDFKDEFQTKDTNAPYAILFCSYSKNLQELHSFTLPNVIAKLTLACVTSPPNRPEDMSPVGLLLDWEEYLGVLTRFKDKRLLIDNELREFIFDFTAGHVGAAKAMFGWLIKMVRCLIPYHMLLLIFFPGGS